MSNQENIRLLINEKDLCVTVKVEGANVIIQNNNLTLDQLKDVLWRIVSLRPGNVELATSNTVQLGNAQALIPDFSGLEAGREGFFKKNELVSSTAQNLLNQSEGRIAVRE